MDELIFQVLRYFILNFIYRNIIHGSDSVESANKEIALWFTDAELVSWAPVSAPWLYE
jgi:nucleoside-diphosphate kinase